MQGDHGQFRHIWEDIDLTQITLRSELFSKIKCSIVVLRDRIHKELENQINLIRVIKLG